MRSGFTQQLRGGRTLTGKPGTWVEGRTRRQGTLRQLRPLGIGSFVAALLFALAGAAPPASSTAPQLIDVTEAAGIHFVHVSGSKTRKDYLFEVKGGGVAFLDFDGDGWLDLLLVQGSTWTAFKQGERSRASLYRNRRDGTFEEVTSKAGLLSSGWGMGVTTADYDNDGFVDVFLTGLTGSRLYHNQGDGTFRDVTAEAGVGGELWSTSAAFGDYDADGYLDLFVCNYVRLDLDHLPEPGSGPRCNYRGRPGYCGPLGLEGAPNQLYRNRGDGTFEEVTHQVGVAGRQDYFSLGVVWADLDNDHDLDLVIGNDSTPNEIYRNNGQAGFEDVSLRCGLAANGDGRFQASMGMDAADYDNDGRLDVYATHFANDYSTLYLNQSGFRFLDVTMEAHLAQPEWLWVSWGTRFVDLNGDGWKDIVHANGHVYPFLLTAGWAEAYGQPLSVYLNQADGTFLDASDRCGPDAQARTVSRGVAFGDYDNDGDVDFAVANLDDRPQLFRNDSVAAHHWIMLAFRGSRSNRDGIGARVRLEAAGESQVWEVKRAVSIYSASDPRAHFGLGRAEQVDSLTVQWPSGQVDEFQAVAVDAHYLVIEGQGIQRELSDRP